MTTATSLTLRALFSQAAAKAALDRSAPITAGLTPQAQALAAAVASRTSTGVTLLIAPTDKDVEQLTADARFFYGALEEIMTGWLLGELEADVAEAERAVVDIVCGGLDPAPVAAQ